MKDPMQIAMEKARTELARSFYLEILIEEGKRQGYTSAHYWCNGEPKKAFKYERIKEIVEISNYLAENFLKAEKDLKQCKHCNGTGQIPRFGGISVPCECSELDYDKTKLDKF